jgi:hypothetical protein
MFILFGLVHRVLIDPFQGAVIDRFRVRVRSELRIKKALQRLAKSTTRSIVSSSTFGHLFRYAPFACRASPQRAQRCHHFGPGAPWLVVPIATVSVRRSGVAHFRALRVQLHHVTLRAASRIAPTAQSVRVTHRLLGVALAFDDVRRVVQ